MSAVLFYNASPQELAELKAVLAQDLCVSADQEFEHLLSPYRKVNLACST